MAGPVAVVLAGIVTTYLAVVSSDGLVADDYYKRGLAINQTLSRDAVARAMGYRAHIVFAENGRLTVTLDGTGVRPAQILLRFTHIGRAAFDKAVPLTIAAGAHYSAVLPPLETGRWQLTLEDAARSWRLTGNLRVPGTSTIDLAPPLD